MYSVLDSISCSLYSIRFLYLVSIAYIAITGLSPYVPPFKYKTRSLNRCLQVASMFWERFSGTAKTSSFLYCIPCATPTEYQIPLQRKTGRR